jgi:glycosyltransferase involved in cell wall biosynthesis
VDDPSAGADTIDCRVAVIIPCYRQACFLGQAIESVLSQSRPAHEILVIDDGSPDDASRVAAAYPAVRCIRQRNTGLAGARNRGIRETASEFLVFLDADDRLLPNALDAGVRALQSSSELAFAWGFNRPIDAGGVSIGGISNPFDADPGYAQLLERNIVGPPAGVMFRRGPLVAAGGFSVTLDSAEDYDLYLRLARQHRFACHGQTVAEYRHHDANMSSDNARMLSAIRTVLAQQAAWVGDEPQLAGSIARGLRHARIRHEVAPAIDEITQSLRGGDWPRALGRCPQLLRSPWLVAGEVRRRLAARRRRLPTRA